MSRAKPPEERTGNDWKPAVPDTVTDVEWVTPECPADVDLQLWTNVWELGGPSGVYNAVADYQVILRYCQMVERRETFLARLDKEGWTEIGSQGQTVQHPAARMLAETEAKMVPLEDRLGLNPQARHTIQVGHVQAKSALEKWMEE